MTGTTVRSGLRPLTQLRPALRKIASPAPEADRKATA
jgi:hypothetical protein